MNEPTTPETPKPPILFDLDGKKLTPEEYHKEFQKLGDKLRTAAPAPEVKK